ncbi:MAG: exopolysaccharide Pel transporter PelG [Verrucomicrobiales bacterium]|nr:exopolysaccharide Pel transporter PelG [Verrucomicrobiales bacterium]
MNVEGYHHKKLFSRFGVEAGFLPDFCVITSAFVILVVRMSAPTVSTVTALALELTIVQFLVASMCWAIRQYSIDSTRRGDLAFAALPRQPLLFTGIALCLVAGTLLTIFLSPERGFSLCLLLILAGNVSLFFLVALFVVETIPLSRVLLLALALFACAAAISYFWNIRSKTSLSILIIGTMATGIFFMALLSKKTGSSHSSGRFLKFLTRQPLFLVCGPLYLFGFWLDKWIFWFFVDNRTLDHTLLRPTASDQSGVLALLFTIPALFVAFYSFRTEIARNYENFSTYILGTGTLNDIETSRSDVEKAVKVGCINTALTQLVFSGGLFFFAPALVEHLDRSVFNPLTLKSAAIGNIFFVVYAFLFRALLYFEDLRSAFWSGIGFCLGSIVFASGMMFFDVTFGGIGLGMAATVGIVTASIPLRRRLSELDYLFFTKYQ